MDMATRFRLAELLEAANMTQTDLHRRSGIGYSTINGMVLNKARQVSLNTLDALSEALGCAPGDLVVREGKSRRK
jgi:DNA-binding Xre family transcriptional regulator